MKPIYIATLLFCALISCSKGDSVSSSDTPPSQFPSISKSQTNESYFESWNLEQCKKSEIIPKLNNNLSNLSDQDYNAFSTLAINCALEHYSRDEFYDILLRLGKEDKVRGDPNYIIPISTAIYCQEPKIGQTFKRKEAINSAKAYTLQNPKNELVKIHFKLLERDFERQKFGKNCSLGDCSDSNEPIICVR